MKRAWHLYPFSPPQEAEKMVAYLQDGVVDDEQLAKSAERPKPTALPISHEAAFKWFYKDPQGEIQGEQMHVHWTIVTGPADH